MEKNNEVEEDWNVTCSKEKTDWGFVINLMCIGALLWMICFIGIQFERQSIRIDRLELEIISLTGSKQQKAEVKWHDKDLELE